MNNVFYFTATTVPDPPALLNLHSSDVLNSGRSVTVWNLNSVTQMLEKVLLWFRKVARLRKVQRVRDCAAVITVRLGIFVKICSYSSNFGKKLISLLFVDLAFLK